MQPPDRGSWPLRPPMPAATIRWSVLRQNEPGSGWHAIWSARLASVIVDYCRYRLAPAAGGCDSEATVQLRAFIGALLLLGLVSAPVRADEKNDAKEQVKFGIKVAQLGLWREALAHWERAIKLDPTYAPAYNNLAIGYEQQGDFEKARNAYQKALELNPSNQYIKQNYELFKEINDRTNKQDGR